MQVKTLFRSFAVSFLALAAILTIIGILRRDRGGWTQYERGLIHRSDSLMNVTLMPKDSAIALESNYKTEIKNVLCVTKFNLD